MTYPDLEISTSVSSLLLRIQRVEFDVTYIITPSYGTFGVAFDYSNRKLTMFLWPNITHINEPDTYICKQQRLRKGPAVYVVLPMSLLPN